MLSPKQERNLFVGVFVFVFLISGCAIKNPKATLPANSPEAIMRSSLEISNGVLNIAVAFYTDQRTACALGQMRANSRCRFSAGGIEGYRLSLAKANTVFQVAVTAVETWKKSQTPENFAAASTAIADLKLTTKSVSDTTAALQGAKP